MNYNEYLWNPDCSKEEKIKVIEDTIEEIKTECPKPNLRKTAIISYLSGVLDGLNEEHIKLIFDKIQSMNS